MKRTKRGAMQRTLEFKTHGGKRRGAGRKARNGKRNGPEHRLRRRFQSRRPCHVTLRLERNLPNLRERGTFKEVKGVLRKFAEYCSIRIVHFSVQKNHLHLVVEAESWRALSSAIRSLEIQLAWTINRIAGGRRGRVFKHRYDVVQLGSPRQVRAALVYVLGNARKHAAQQGIVIPPNWVDPNSSGGWFDGWARGGQLTPKEDWPRPKLWLLTTGWRRHGLIRVDEAPAT